MSRGPQVLPPPALPPPDGFAARPVVHPLLARNNTLFPLSLTPRTFPRRQRAFPLFLVPYSCSLRTYSSNVDDDGGKMQVNFKMKKKIRAFKNWVRQLTREKEA